jgi:inorganic triphosphatase YgiF
VKTEFGDDPPRRGEWEASVPSIDPDLGLATPFIPAKLRSDLERHQLEAVFTADIHRRTRIIELPSGTVEIAFDHGCLKSGNRSMPVSEIELELKGGSAGAIYELALRLAEHGSLKPSIRSKATRGFDLAADALPAARKPRKLRLDPSIPLDDAFATILRENFVSSHRYPSMMPSRRSYVPAFTIFSSPCRPPRMAAIPRGFISYASRCAAFGRPWIWCDPLGR